jgi:peptidoglycan/xylan/chitin deacetylase (PgdA/CDA1 family)
MKKTILAIFFIFNLQLSYSQMRVSITIDDVPNTKTNGNGIVSSSLLQKLDSLNIPIAAFVNEGLIYKTNSERENKLLLNEWFKRNYVTIGNHTFAHSRYSEVGLDSFVNDINAGVGLSREMSETYNKKIKYFRFPYNDLGKDSAQQVEIIKYLKSINYSVTPFTIESSDWMYNFVYEYYLEKNDTINAKAIGLEYVSKTIEYFNFFEKICYEIYGHNINQIYLCHDNRINADYIIPLINKLSGKGYQFISFSEALTDAAYQQPDNYYIKWGISWIYRWLQNDVTRKQYMKEEPSTENIEILYNSFNK